MLVSACTTPDIRHLHKCIAHISSAKEGCVFFSYQYRTEVLGDILMPTLPLNPMPLFLLLQNACVVMSLVGKGSMQVAALGTGKQLSPLACSMPFGSHRSMFSFCRRSWISSASFGLTSLAEIANMRHFSPRCPNLSSPLSIRSLRSATACKPCAVSNDTLASLEPLMMLFTCTNQQNNSIIITLQITRASKLTLPTRRNCVLWLLKFFLQKKLALASIKPQSSAQKWSIRPSHYQENHGE